MKRYGKGVNAMVKKRKSGLLQRMMAVLLSAVLVVGMVSNAVPVTVFAQEDGETVGNTQAEEPKEPAQEETKSEEPDTDKPDGSEDTDSDEPEDSDPEDKEDSTPEDPNGGAEQDPPEPDEETGEEVTEPGTEEENESESVGDNDAPTESVSENNITGENNDFQALIARIAALPDAGEYLAGEPDADSGEVDEAAYEEWLAGLYAYAEEAFAIQEVIEELSEEAQAAIPEEALAKLAAWVELAQTLGESAQVMVAESSMVMALAETHRHPVCGGSCGHSDATHPDVEWTALTQDSITANIGNDYTGNYYKLDSGNYYLTEDISIDRMLKCFGEVSLCFNGHKITSSYNGNGFNDSSLAAYKFNACDCGSGGGFISTGRYLLSGTGYANLNLYGGNFVGEDTVHLYTDT